MKTNELIILCILGATIILALITCPFEELATFNPVEWLADSINGFIELISDLFFGWIP